MLQRQLSEAQQESVVADAIRIQLRLHAYVPQSFQYF